MHAAAAAVERQAVLSHAIKFQSLQTFFFCRRPLLVALLNKPKKEEEEKILCVHCVLTIYQQ